MKGSMKAKKNRPVQAKSPLTALKQYRTTIGLLGAVVLVVLGFVLVRSQAATSPAGTDTGMATSCVFSKPGTVAAFCSSFDTAYTGTQTQTGDLDPTLWGVSRLGNVYPDGNGLPATKSNLCSLGTAVLPPKDVRICNGQLVESLNDGGDVVNSDIYPKQPFNFTGRTGTVVFDVSANSEGIHAAWPEFAVTELPVPGTRGNLSQDGIDHATTPDASPHDQNAFGFAIDSCAGSLGATTGVFSYYTVVNGIYNLTYVPVDSDLCLTDGSASKLNHFEVQLSTTHVKILGSNAGSTAMKTLIDQNLDRTLAFSQGLVWMNDAHYNAQKAGLFGSPGLQQDHAVVWDNLGFDGPKTYRDYGFDVPLADERNCNTSADDFSLTCEGYRVDGSRTFSIPNVTWDTTPTKMLVVLNGSLGDATKVTASLNGHAAVASVVKVGYRWESLAMTLPTSDAVKGTNSLTITAAGGLQIANISLIAVAAADVPGGGTVTPTPPPTPPTLKDGDVNGDGSVNIFDASIIAANWGQSGRTRAQGDLTGDGIVNIFDGSILSANWGK